MTRIAPFVLLACAAGVGAGWLAARGAEPPPPPVRPRSAGSPPAPERPGPEGAIRGRTDTERGAPVAGARVAAWTAAGGLAGEATTAADGTFVIGGLPPGWHVLRAAHAAWDFREVTAGPGAQVRLVAEPALGFRVAVRRPDGSVPDRAVLRCQARGVSSRDELSIPWTPAEPCARLGPGSWEVSAAAGEDLEFTSDLGRVLLARGQPAPSLEFVVVPRAGIRGRVVFPPGFPAPAVEVWAEPAGPGAERLCTATEDSGHRYAFVDLPPGRYDLRLENFSERVCPPAEVDVGAEMVTRDLVISAPPGSAAVRLRVVGPDGAPVATASVDPWSKSGADVALDAKDVLPVAPGVYLLPAGPPGDWRVSVSAPGLGARGITLPPAGGEATVQFLEPAWLSASVKGLPPGETPMLGLALEPAPESEALDWAESGRLAREALAVFGPVQPGAYRLTLSHSERALAERDLVLHSGSNEAEILAPALYDLVVLTPRGSGALKLRLEGEGDRFMAEWQDREEDRVIFRALPPGRYVLEMVMSESADGEMVVDVPAAGPVRFVPGPCNALRFVIHDREAPVFRAGLRDGDLVVAIDGQEFRTVSEARALLSVAGSRVSTPFLVLRGAARATVEVPGAALADVPQEGAYFEFAVR